MQNVIDTVWRRGTAHIDVPLLVAVTLLLAVGMVTLYSASNQSFDRMENKLINIGVAFAVMWVAANTPLSQVTRLALPAYVVALVLLLAVALVGDVRNGARRWLDLGPVSIQPSELMKIALPLALAWYFDRYESTLKLWNFAVATMLFILPFGLIARQPDLGTALLIAASGCYVLFLAGLPWKVILALGGAGLAALPLVSMHGEHVAFDSLDALMPAWLRRAQQIAVDLLCALALGLLACCWGTAAASSPQSATGTATARPTC
jgi:rod shape determining protein RodA